MLTPRHTPHATSHHLNPDPDPDPDPDQVEVARRPLAPLGQPMPWRKDFGDPLYMRHLVEDGRDVFHLNIAKVR